MRCYDADDIEARPAVSWRQFILVIPAFLLAAISLQCASVKPPNRVNESAATRPMSSAAEEHARAIELREVYRRPPSQWPAPALDEGVEHRELGLLPPPEFPADNPHSKAKEELGRTLFFDPRLSGSGQIACASCHDPDLAWADGRTVSFGHDRTALAR